MLPFAAVTRQYPSMLTVASAEVRRRVLGMGRISPSVGSVRVVRVCCCRALLRAAAATLRRGSPRFCRAPPTACAETIGRTAYNGLAQQFLSALLCVSINNLHPVLLTLRTRSLIVAPRLDRGRSRLWLRHWKARGDEVRQVVDDRQRDWSDAWYNDGQPSTLACRETER